MKDGLSYVPAKLQFNVMHDKEEIFKKQLVQYCQLLTIAPMVNHAPD